MRPKLYKYVTGNFINPKKLTKGIFFLREAILNSDAPESEEDIEDLGRVLSEALQAVTVLKYKKLNFKTRKGIGTERSMFSYPLYDHMYSLTTPPGRKAIVSEPYNIFSNEIKDMADLIKEGWEIIIRGESLHFPNRTLHIEFYKPLTKKVTVQTACHHVFSSLEHERGLVDSNEESAENQHIGVKLTAKSSDKETRGG